MKYIKNYKLFEETSQHWKSEYKSLQQKVIDNIKKSFFNKFKIDC